MTGSICHPEYPEILVATVQYLVASVWKRDNEEEHYFHYFSYHWGDRKRTARWNWCVARMGADEKCRHNFSQKTISIENNLKIKGQMWK